MVCHRIVKYYLEKTKYPEKLVWVRFLDGARYDIFWIIGY
jgi:hypothetical protein